MDEEFWAEAIKRTVAGWRPIEKPQEWTAEDLATLREMYGAGRSLKAIAKAVGRTRKAVDNKLVRLGLRQRTSRTYDEIIWTPEQVAELQELCADVKLSAGDIAAQMGTTRNAILGKINRLGIQRPERQPSKPKLRPQPRATRREDAVSTVGASGLMDEDRKLHQASQTPSSRLMNEAERFLPAPPKLKHTSGNKTFFDLGPRDCRFPLGKPMEPAVLFCGQQALTGRPYCEEHCRLCGGAYRRG